MNIVKRIITLFLAFAMVICFIPSMGMQKAYAETDIITRVDIETGADLPETIIAGYPVDQPTFTVTNVESELGTVKPSDMVFETSDYYGWCQSYEYTSGIDWFKYAEDGIQDLFFTSGESRMMVDIFANPDKVSALFTEDTKVYLNGQLMSFYKLYANDEDYVGYFSYNAADPLSRIDFTLDRSAFDFNTAYTEDEMDDIIRDYFRYDYSTFYCRSWQGLYYKYVNEDGDVFWWSANENDDYLDTSKEYAVGVQTLSIDSSANKYWPYSVIKCYNTTISGEIAGFDVYLNGEKRDDAWLEGRDTGGDLRTYFYIPLGPVSTDPIAKSVTIQQNDVSVKAGSSYTFSAVVEGTVTDKTVSWSVENALSSQTKISNAGVLTVGEDETAETITVRATSNGDPRKSDERTVTVLAEDPVIESVKITPVDPTLYPGTEQQFSVEVTGTQTDKSVTWGISGTCTSDKTTITQEGLLKVGADEKTPSFRVTAVSNADGCTSDSVLVYIKQKTIINEIRFTLDTSAFELTPAYTEDEMDDIIRSAFGYDDSTFYCRSWEGLYYKYINEDGQVSWISCNESDEYIDPNKEYAAGVLGLSIDNSVGKDWPDSVKAFNDLGLSGDVSGFDVYVNDVKRDDIWMEGWDTGGDVRTYFYVPLKFDITKATVTGIKEKTYTGKALAQSPTVKFGDKLLVKGTDYTLTYKNNTNAGTATVAINGKGNFEGKISKTFKINPASLSSCTNLTFAARDYTGSAIKPVPVIKFNGKELVNGTDFTVKYSNNVKIGTATVTATGKGNFKETKKITFKIKGNLEKAATKVSVQTIAKKTYSGSAQTPKPWVKAVRPDGTVDKLKAGTDFEYSYKNNKYVGKASLMITGKGNYKGTKTVYFTINPKGTTLKSLTALSKGFKATWNKQAVQTDGYDIIYSSKSDFSTYALKTVKSNTTLIASYTGLSANRKYYVKIRTYKVVSGTKYKSAWSPVMTVTTKA